jgi:hypothetical protein
MFLKKIRNNAWSYILDIVHDLKIYEMQYFGYWIYFHHQV